MATTQVEDAPPGRVLYLCYVPGWGVGGPFRLDVDWTPDAENAFNQFVRGNKDRNFLKSSSVIDRWLGL